MCVLGGGGEVMLESFMLAKPALQTVVSFMLKVGTGRQQTEKDFSNLAQC